MRHMTFLRSDIEIPFSCVRSIVNALIEDPKLKDYGIDIEDDIIGKSLMKHYDQLVSPYLASVIRRVLLTCGMPTVSESPIRLGKLLDRPNYEIRATDALYRVLETIAPWIKTGSQIIWQGDNPQKLYRWAFDCGDVIEGTADIVWKPVMDDDEED